MILFKEIYNKAINLFDDPDIQLAYAQDAVRFEKLMYPYLENGVNYFTNPTKMSFLLTAQTPPSGSLETFESTGGNTFQLSTTPEENSDFSYTVNGQYVHNATYDAETNSVTFSEDIPAGATVGIEWYFSGSFDGDFSSVATTYMPEDVILARVKEILARALILCWSEEERNFVLEIKNILTDTDFKIYSPANSVRAKTEWVNQIRHDFDSMQTKLAWDVSTRRRNGGSYYG